jgi:hypothetical protein
MVHVYHGTRVHTLVLVSTMVFEIMLYLYTWTYGVHVYLSGHVYVPWYTCTIWYSSTMVRTSGTY